MPIVREKFKTLITTATRLFAENSYDGTATLEISKHVGVTEPLIYYYFPKKSNLYNHIVTNAHGLYQQRLRELPQSAKRTDRLDKLVQAHHRFAKEHPFEAALVARPVPRSLEDGREDLEKMAADTREMLRKTLTAAIREGIAGGAYTEVNVGLTVNLIIMMLIRLFDSATEKSVKTFGSAMTAFFRRGLENRLPAD